MWDVRPALGNTALDFMKTIKYAKILYFAWVHLSRIHFTQIIKRQKTLMVILHITDNKSTN